MTSSKPVPTRDELIEAIRAAPVRSLTRRLHDLRPEIERRLSERVTYRDIAESLGKAGMEVNPATLRSYVAQWRKAERKAG